MVVVADFKCVFGKANISFYTVGVISSDCCLIYDVFH